MIGVGETAVRMGSALVVVLLLGTTAWAEPRFENDRKQCISSGSDPDIQIDACTRLIQSGRYSHSPHRSVLAIAFYNRGIAHGKKGEFEGAIKDYSQAIRINLRFTEAFYNRGLSYGKKGVFDKAIKDFKEAYALGSRNPFLLKKLNEHGFFEKDRQKGNR